MPKLRVHAFSISLDGYGAGPKQDRDDPLGVGGEALHEWFVATRTFRQMSGKEGGTTGVDDDFAARGFSNLGAGSWVAICSGLSEDIGPMTPGRDGGATTRLTTAPCSCSPATPGHRSLWTAAPPSTS